MLLYNKERFWGMSAKINAWWLVILGALPL